MATPRADMQQIPDEAQFPALQPAVTSSFLESLKEGLTVIIKNVLKALLSNQSGAELGLEDLIENQMNSQWKKLMSQVPLLKATGTPADHNIETMKKSLGGPAQGKHRPMSQAAEDMDYTTSSHRKRTRSGSEQETGEEGSAKKKADPPQVCN